MIRAPDRSNGILHLIPRYLFIRFRAKWEHYEERKKRINAANLQEQIPFNRIKTVFFQYTQTPENERIRREKKEKCIL